MSILQGLTISVFLQEDGLPGEIDRLSGDPIVQRNYHRGREVRETIVTFSVLTATLYQYLAHKSVPLRGLGNRPTTGLKLMGREGNRKNISGCNRILVHAPHRCAGE